MQKVYYVQQYLNTISKCESRSFKNYLHERLNKKTRSMATPRQYHYFTYIEDTLKNYDMSDELIVHDNGDYGIRRKGTEVGYGRFDLHLISNPCYPKYTKIL